MLTILRNIYFQFFIQIVDMFANVDYIKKYIFSILSIVSSRANCVSSGGDFGLQCFLESVVEMFTLSFYVLINSNAA
jgi:hypothetical protein